MSIKTANLTVPQQTTKTEARSGYNHPVPLYFCHRRVGPVHGSRLSLLADEFHLDETQLGLLTGACMLALGYANFIIVPCSNVFGPRMTSLLFGIFGILTSFVRSHGNITPQPTRNPCNEWSVDSDQ